MDTVRHQASTKTFALYVLSNIHNTSNVMDSEISQPADVNSCASWDITVCRVYNANRYWKRAYCLHLQGRREGNWHEEGLTYCQTLKTEARYSSDTSVHLHQTTRDYKSRSNIFGIATWYGLDDRGVRVRVSIWSII
jgi:hypothetical protein